MAEFQLDTSGAVERPAGYTRWGVDRALTWEDLSPFVQGYVEAAIKSLGRVARCPVCCSTGTVVRYKRPPMSITCGQCDGAGKEFARFRFLAPETLALILKDCEAATEGRLDGSAKHGCWLWQDRNNSVCRGFPPLTPTLADDGKVYLREAGQ